MSAGPSRPLVAVPVYGRLDALRTCLASLDACTPPDVEVLVIDDRGPQSPDDAMVADLLAGSGRPSTFVRNPRNLGFVGSANRAMQSAAGRDLVLVNSDVTVYPGWLEGLEAAIGSGADVASATALGDDAGIVTIALDGRSPSAVAAGLREAAAIATAIPVAVGHCVYLRAEALAAVGGFDVAFSPGYGEEVDWSWRAAEAGWRHVAALRTYVSHAAGSSFSQLQGRDRMRRRGELRLLRRHPVRFARLRLDLRGSDHTLARTLAAVSAGLDSQPAPAALAHPGEAAPPAPGVQPVVLLDATAIPADRRGVGRYVEELVRHLPAAGVDLHVAVQARDLAHFRTHLPADRLHAAPSAVSRRPTRLAWEQYGLPALVRRLDVDLVHSPHYTMPLGTRTPVVVTVHDATFFTMPEVHEKAKARFFRGWTRLSVRRAAALVAPSRATADEVHRLLGGPHATVIPMGVDHQRFHPPTPDEVAALRARIGVDGSYIAFLGTMEPRKNVPALIRAWTAVCEGLAEPPALVLAGGSGWDTTLDAAVAAVPPGLRVVRPGFLPDELLGALLGAATVVAYPPLGEGFGLPVLEAMACGAVVVTTRMLSLPEVGGDAVLYADSPSAQDIASTLRHALSGDPALDALRERATARAAGFTWEAVATAHRAVYAAVAAGRHAGGTLGP